MNQDQYQRCLRAVFNELQNSGLAIASEVYVILGRLFTDFKTMEKVRDDAINNSVSLYADLVLEREKVRILKEKLAVYEQINSKELV